MDDVTSGVCAVLDATPDLGKASLRQSNAQQGKRRAADKNKTAVASHAGWSISGA